LSDSVSDVESHRSVGHDIKYRNDVCGSLERKAEEL
jgi:hypothetical protein